MVFLPHQEDAQTVPFLETATPYQLPEFQDRQ